jgi:hypothetical protein
MRLVASGDVFLDFLMSKDPAGRVKDHGFLWRIKTSALPKLYLFSEEQKM